MQDNNLNLKDLAMEAASDTNSEYMKNAELSLDPIPQQAPTQTANQNQTTSMPQSNPVTPVGLDLSTLSNDTPVVKVINPDDITSSLGTSDIEYIRSNLTECVTRHRGNLIAFKGMDPLVADREARKVIMAYLSNNDTQMNNQNNVTQAVTDTTEVVNTEEVIEESQEETPIAPEEVASVIIDKTADPNDLQLTNEEHEKLTRARQIKLIAVEDMDLSNLTIERPDEETKMTYIRNIEGSNSRHSIPLTILGDYVYFRGAQMGQLLNLALEEGAKLEDVITAKASLIYDKILRGAILDKYDETGHVKMSYTQFVNLFPYPDLDLAVYSILCASSADTQHTSLRCDKCNQVFDYAYSIKEVLNMDNAPDYFKQRFDDILDNHHSNSKLKELHEKMWKVKRYKSPFSGNIFDLSFPTIARATSVFEAIDQTDKVAVYNAAIMLYLQTIYVYNAEKNSYVEVGSGDAPDEMFETLKLLSEDDIQLISNQVSEELYYEPEFVVKSHCPHCQANMSDTVKVEHLVFLRAQSSNQIEIQS